MEIAHREQDCPCVTLLKRIGFKIEFCFHRKAFERLDIGGLDDQKFTRINLFGGDINTYRIVRGKSELIRSLAKKVPVIPLVPLQLHDASVQAVLLQEPDWIHWFFGTVYQVIILVYEKVKNIRLCFKIIAQDRILADTEAVTVSSLQVIGPCRMEFSVGLSHLPLII